MIKTNVNSSEGIEVSSVDYKIPEISKKMIETALNSLKVFSVLKYCAIDGYQVWATVKQYNSTIDDEERQEIKRGDIFEFRSDVQYLKVFPSGRVTLVAYNKWGEGTVEFDLE